jgi:lipase
VACPVLLIEGGASPPVIGQILDTLEAGLADVRRVRIEGAGHMVPMSHAAEVGDAVGDMLDHVEAGAGKRAFSG